MEIREATAPSYAALRPLKQRVTPTFPVYHGLVDNLLNSNLRLDPTLAHVLGTCSGYAYADEQTVAMIMARMGLEDARCRTIGQYVDAMFISSTAYIVQSKCGRVVILCYRGTEPDNFINWLTDADVNPAKVPFVFAGRDDSPFLIHGGFYRNVRSTRFEVVTSLQRALRGESIFGEGGKVDCPLQALYLTGHSLGGAMAVIMGVMLTTEPAYAELAQKLRSIYTFGQPMVGSPDFAAACEGDPFLGRNVFRYVYGHDVVPSLPPAASGPFAHFGPEHRAHSKDGAMFEATSERTTQVSHLVHLVEAPIAFLARQIQFLRNVPFQYSIGDHGPQHYIQALTPPGVISEYGD